MNILLQNAIPTLYDGVSTDMLGLIAAVMLGFMAVFFVIVLVLYVYMGFALMKVAQRLKTEPTWLAWVPIGNLYLMSKMAKMDWWPMLLLLGIWIPFLGIFAMIAFGAFAFIWTWKILEARKRPGWWVLLSLIPFAGSLWSLVMWGILAWAKD
ncbi:MAG: hypothetical protein AABW92_00520 [Nanoarchaeota archaeon]